MTEKRSKIEAEIESLISEIGTEDSVSGEYRYRSYSRTLSKFEVSDWLENQTMFPKLYWKSRDSEIEFAACGAIWELGQNESLETCETVLTRCAPDIKLMMSLPFDPENEIQRCVFLPQLMVTVGSSSVTFTVNLEFENGQPINIDACKNVLKNIDWAPATQGLIGARIQNISHSINRSDWIDKITRTIGQFEAIGIEKLVVARQTEVQLSRPVGVNAILKCLLHPTNQHYLFWTSKSAGHTFFGRSPERLFKLHKSVLETEALAGTRKKTTNAEVPENSFLTDPKEQREQQIVEEDIRHQLESLGDPQNQSVPPKIQHASSLLHIKTELLYRLKSEITWVRVLRAMHPTAAVGCYPRKLSTGDFRQFDKFDRGRYAAPIGWVDQSGAEFAVGIRSGVISSNHLTLFAGTGIVKDSIPINEWNELDAKIAEILEIFE